MFPGKYQKNSFMDEFKESLKYVDSFEVTVPIGGRLLQAIIKPLENQVYTVVLNNIFLAHLVKHEGVWKDYFGKTDELYETVGQLIEKHLSKK